MQKSPGFRSGDLAGWFFSYNPVVLISGIKRVMNIYVKMRRTSIIHTILQVQVNHYQPHLSISKCLYSNFADVHCDTKIGTNILTLPSRGKIVSKIDFFSFFNQRENCTRVAKSYKFFENGTCTDLPCVCIQFGNFLAYLRTATRELHCISALTKVHISIFLYYLLISEQMHFSRLLRFMQAKISQ